MQAMDADTIRAVAKLAHLGCWQMDCNSPLQSLSWDEYCHQLHGTEVGRFEPTLGQVLLLYQEQSRSKLEDALMACTMQGDSFEVEVDCWIGAGHVRRLLVAGMSRQQGRQIVGYYQDVSQRAQIVKLMHQEHAQLQALLRALPDLLFTVDAGGHFRQYHSGQSLLLTEPPESYLGKEIGEAFPFLRSDFPAAFRRANETGEIVSFEFQLHMKAGEGCFEARLIPLEGAMKKLGLLLIRDISEQHRKNQELKSSQQAALQASRVKSQFLANMSHEIRTPLNGVLGMTELLLGTELGAEQREYAQTAQRSAQILLETVSDILDLSKIEANRLELETIPFSVRTLVQDALSSLGLKAHEKGLELVGSVGPSVPSRVVGDPTRIRQLITNLISNAIKFTAQGEIELQINQREPGLIRVSVYDTGEGIAYERQREIFEAFTQADGSTTRRHGGTGLGLTICKQLVEKMGGRIWLESQPGQGSRFNFTAKLANYHADLKEPEGPYGAFIRDLDRPDLTAEEFSQEIQPRRVLVVDDNSSCRRILKEALANWGIHAQVAVGPGPAVQMVREAQRLGKPFDLVILDFQMPGLDGVELSKELPEGLSRLLMVTLGRPGAEQLAEAGISKVVIKPLLAPELARALMYYFRQSEAGHSVAQQPVRSAGPLRILMAEDNMVNAKVVTKMLQRLGHQITHVVNGELAVEFLRNNEVDVVLMDVQMPVMDGLEATRRWRALETKLNRRVPIVALTGNAMSSDREMCLESGMDLHLTKPIRLELLDQMLTALPHS